MAVKSKNRKRPRKPRTGSGLKGVWKARRILRKIKMKINRWKKNQMDESKKHIFKKNQNVRRRSRHDNWNTAGLEKYAQLLEKIIKKGKKSVRKGLRG